MTDLNPNDLFDPTSGDPEELDVHLRLVERDFVTKTSLLVKVHCHCLEVDAKGNLREVRERILGQYENPATAEGELA